MKRTVHIFLGIIANLAWCPVAYSYISYELGVDHITNAKLEKYIHAGALGDVRSFRSKTRMQLSSQLTQLHKKGLLRQSDLWMLEDFGLLEDQKEGWHVHAFVRSEGLFTNANPSRILDSGAMINPLLNQHRGGRFISSQTIFNLEPRLILENTKWFSLDLWPQISFTDNDDWNLDFHQAVLKLGVRNVELAVGRLHFQWGQGRYASTLFTGSQKPLNMIRLQNVEPIAPGWFKFLGEGKFTLFFAKLDDNQVLPGSILVGERLAFRVNSKFEFGVTQMIQVGGQGYPDVPWYENVSEVLGYRFAADDTNFTNRNAVVDFRFRIPRFNDLNIYGEIFFEDCCTINFDKNIGNMFGIEIPDVGAKKPTSLGFEFLRTTFVYNRHFRYLSGFTFDGVSMGHHIGADSLGFYLFMRQDITDRANHEIVGALEVRQVNEYTQRKTDIRTLVADYEDREKRYRLMYKLTNQINQHWSTSLRLGSEYVQSFNFQDGDDEIFLLGHIQLGYAF